MRISVFIDTGLVCSGMLRTKQFAIFCRILIFFTFLLFGQTNAEGRKTFSGDKVLQVIPGTKEALKYLNNLFDKNDFELDFWTYPSKIGESVDIHVTHRWAREFKHFLTRREISFRVKIRNLQRLINGERMRARSGVPFNGAFRSYSQIVHEMRRLQRLNETLVEVFSIGKTYENRTIHGIKISSNRSLTNKSVMFINCGLHAREWIAISTCVYVARELVLKYRTDESIRDLVDKLEWIVIPVVNVDGYVYTHSTNRMWRKNRRPSNSTQCVGTDLNRNFNIKWATVGAEYGKPCSDIYPGLWPFSEPETRNLGKYMYSIRRRIKGYVDFHCYGQLWMSPWGFTTVLPPTFHKEHLPAMRKIVQKIYHTHGTIFQYGPASTAIYKTSGDATDWVHGVLGVTHSYGVELQPSFFAENGFILPPSYIEPVGKETLSGLKILCSFIS